MASQVDDPSQATISTEPERLWDALPKTITDELMMVVKEEHRQDAFVVALNKQILIEAGASPFAAQAFEHHLGPALMWRRRREESSEDEKHGDTPLTAETLDRRIVMIQSAYRDYKSNYLNADEGLVVRHPAIDYHSAPWRNSNKWVIHADKSTNTIVFESVEFPNHYLDATGNEAQNGSYFVALTYQPAPPIDKNWAQFKLYSLPDENLFVLESMRYPGWYLHAAQHHNVFVSGGIRHESFAIWRFVIGGPVRGTHDMWSVVKTHDNAGSTPVSFKFIKTVGSETTQGKHEKQVAAIAAQASANFKMGKLKLGAKVDVSYSKEWGSSSSATWMTRTTTEITINVPARTRMTILQLQGVYGPLIINSNHTRNMEEQL